MFLLLFTQTSIAVIELVSQRLQMSAGIFAKKSWHVKWKKCMWIKGVKVRTKEAFLSFLGSQKSRQCKLTCYHLPLCDATLWPIPLARPDTRIAQFIEMSKSALRDRLKSNSVLCWTNSKSIYSKWQNYALAKPLVEASADVILIPKQINTTNSTCENLATTAVLPISKWLRTLLSFLL